MQVELKKDVPLYTMFKRGKVHQTGTIVKGCVIQLVEVRNKPAMGTNWVKPARVAKITLDVGQGFARVSDLRKAGVKVPRQKSPAKKKN